MNSPHRIAPKRSSAFSLIEMLVVISIMTLLASVSMYAFHNTMRADTLNACGRAVTDQLNLARQIAMARNTPVEVRFYQLPDYNESASAPNVFRAFQLILLDKKGEVPLGKTEFLKNPVYIVPNGDQSPLVTQNPPSSGSTTLIKVGKYGNQYNYISFSYRPDGSTDLTIDSNFLTLALLNDKPVAQGANFITLQIDPVTGSVRNFRP